MYSVLKFTLFNWDSILSTTSSKCIVLSSFYWMIVSYFLVVSLINIINQTFVMLWSSFYFLICNLKLSLASKKVAESAFDSWTKIKLIIEVDWNRKDIISKYFVQFSVTVYSDTKIYSLSFVPKILVIESDLSIGLLVNCFLS